MDVVVRRALQGDIPAIREIFSAEGWDRRYGDVNFSELIELSFLSTVAVREEEGEERVVAFAAFNDYPNREPMHTKRQIPPASWEKWIESFDRTRTPDLQPVNTLWLSLFVADQVSADTALEETLKTLAITVPSFIYLLFASDTSVGLFAPLLSVFQRLPPLDNAPPTHTSVYYCLKTEVAPNLVIRRGLVEDFDDLMPLLQRGAGVLTTPPEEFFLDETLENQNEHHSVLVAEDPLTGAIVGLLCMASGVEGQAHVTKHYNTEVYNKFRPVFEPDNTGVRCNSFQITFFYLNPDYESRAASFIDPAFAEFPNAEYCFIALPHSTTEHPLLTDFSYIPLKQGLTLPNGIWVLCRCSLQPLILAETNLDDLEVLEPVLEMQAELSPEASRRLIGAMRSCADQRETGTADAEELSYGLFHEGVPVGACCVKKLTHHAVHHLRTKYEFEHIVNFVSSGRPDYTSTDIDPNAPDRRHELSASLPCLLITHFYIRHPFKNRIRSLLREVLRQAGAEAVFYCTGPTDEASMPLLAELILALPRKQINPSPVESAGVPPTEEELMCLHFMTRKQLSDEKTKIYARLVVVGASTTGLAAIYAWLTIPYLHIANIVLVSRDGIPNHPNADQESECWGVDTLTWTENEFFLFRVGHKVRIIEGTMIDFERSDKYIVTDNGFIEPYDHLIITAGRQYTIPKELASRHLAKNGIFELSSQAQIHKIMQHIRESEAYEDELSNAVIYGSGKEVYAVATALTRVGLSPSRLVIVSPDDTSGDGNSMFDDPLVDIKVDKLMESLGAKSYKNHVLDRMDYDEDHNLSSVYIVHQNDLEQKKPEALPGGQHKQQQQEIFGSSKQRKVVEIPATMFIYCHEKDIDGQILSALNKRSIVFDGRVIVRYNYRTTDPNIYAVGPIAMFSGRFGPSEEFELFNPQEVGARFAETVLGFIGVEEFHDEEEEEEEEEEERATLQDPSAAQAPVGDDLQTRDQLLTQLPQYKEKVSCRLQLPNNFHYFRCRTVKYLEVAEQCQNLVSYNERGDNYLRLCVSPNKYIEAISYFGSEEVEMRNLQTLVGFPESLLNIVYEYEQSKKGRTPTLDLLQYLRSKWAHAVYFSAFPKFFQNLRQKLLQDEQTQRLREVVADYIKQSGGEEIDEASRNQLLDSITEDGSSTRHLIELEMLKFLHSSKHHFPTIYYLPDVTKFAPPCY